VRLRLEVHLWSWSYRCVPTANCRRVPSYRFQVLLKAPQLVHSDIMQNHPQEHCCLADKQHGNKMLNVANANVWQLVIAVQKTPKKGVAIYNTGKNKWEMI